MKNKIRFNKQCERLTCKKGLKSFPPPFRTLDSADFISSLAARWLSVAISNSRVNSNALFSCASTNSFC